MNKGIFTRLTRPLLQRQSLLNIANVIKHRHAFGLVYNHGATNDDETDGIAAAACRHPSTNANEQQRRTEKSHGVVGSLATPAAAFPKNQRIVVFRLIR